MTRNGQPVDYAYQVRGRGGQGACIAVQSVLQDYGLCGYTQWNSPEWHFIFLTHLDSGVITDLLGDLARNYAIQVENGAPYLPG
jgi:hypothetical protein